jgi:glycosyltransferase involved in cell wall biosynthesis
VDDTSQPFVEIGPHKPKAIAPEFDETKDVSFFVPCLNEEQHVAATINRLASVSTGLGLTYEILVFDDGSKDRTVGVVEEFQATHPDVLVRLFVNKVNQGVARNFIEAAFQGRGRHFRLVNGDDVEPDETLRAILEQLGKADIIIPYHTKVEGRPWLRKVISKTYTRLVNLVSGRHLNYYNGLPLFRRRDVMRFHVEATGLGYQAEFLLRLLQENRTYLQIPLTATDREGSVALSARNFVSVGYSLFKILMRRIRKAMFG